MKKIFLFFAVIALISFVAADDQLGAKCGVCKFLVNEIKKNIDKYEDRITEAFKKHVCGKLGPAEPVCKTFVDMYGKQIIEKLKQKIDPETICKALNLCEKAHMMLVEHELQYVADSPACPICKFIVQIITENLDKRKDEIIEILLAKCAQLPKVPATICQGAVMMFGEKIIDWIIEQGKHPDEICALLKMCDPVEEYTDDVWETAKCIFKCLKGKLPIGRIVEIVIKCKNQIPCYIAELGPDAAECVKNCI